jgi:hypothetical protein
MNKTEEWMEMLCWIYCIIFQTDSTEYQSFFHHLSVIDCYIFYVSWKKQKNKKAEVFTDLLVAEIISINLSTASSKWVNDFTIDMPASVICSCHYMK